MTYPIIFCGAGPGDPDLITVKGMKALKAADLIVYAGSLVPEAVLTWADKEAVLQNSAHMHLGEVLSAMTEAWRDGKRVVRLHSGDPSLYGAIAEQIEELEKQDIPYEVIPGVTAAFAAAAGMGLEYTIPEVGQTLILTRMAGRTPVPDTESLKLLAAHKAAMAIYLSISMVDDIQDVLTVAYGKKAPALIAYRVSKPGQIFIRTTIDHLAETVRYNAIKKQALIIVGSVLDAQRIEKRSRLYDKCFEHMYRKAME